MNFYTNTHPYYCGIDLHTRLLYVCIIDNENNILVHEKIDDSPDKLLTLLKPYLGNIVVGVECMPIQKSMDLNLNIIETMVSELYNIEHYVKTQAQTHRATDLHILKSFPGIGKILALTILYEVGDIKRFPSV